jgi:putative chitobiose transport system permease protein
MSTTASVGRRRPAGGRIRRNTGRLSLTLLALAITLMFLIPVLWLLASSFRTTVETTQSSSTLSWWTLWPHDWTVDNYVSAFESGFARSLGNSVLVSVAVLGLGLFLSATAAFALAVMPFPGRGMTFAFIVLSFLVPFEAVAIPLSRTFASWNLTNSYPGLILPGLGAGLAVFTLRQYFLGIPASLAEAAKVDGAGWWRIFFFIYLPLSRPPLIGAGLLLFLGTWSAYLWPILIVNDSDYDIAPVAIAKSFGAFGSDQGRVFAETAILAVIPAVILLALQRYFVASASLSGSKE